MNLAAILLVTLSGDGYWLSGRTEAVSVQWAVESPPADANLTWKLVCGNAPLASGRLVLPAERRPGVIRLVVPRVRTHTSMQLIYRAGQAGNAKAIAEGKLSIEVYPDDLLANVARRMAAKHLLVWDVPEGLPAVLSRAGVPYTRISGEAQLQFVRPDMVIVAAGRLGKELQGQGALVNLASAGTSVLVLRQTQPDSLAGYPLIRRKAPAKLAWLADHPLAEHLKLCSPSSPGGDAWAVRLPADEAALEIAWWPREVAAARPAPIDALVVSKTLRKGRIVLCQIPLGPWQSDPRSQLFLLDALDYLASPVVPTPPPSRRPRPIESAPAPEVPSILLP